jgi:integrase/recombinase XerD
MGPGLQLTDSRCFITKSTERFAPFGQPKAGVPIFHDDRIRLLEVPTQFMFWLSNRGKSSRPNTWRSYGDDLLDFLRVCEANGWDYLSFARGQLAAYRDSLRSRVSVRKAPLNRSTINRRLGTVCAFFDWLLRNGHISELPYEREERSVNSRDWDILAHTGDRKGYVDDVRLPPTPVRVPIALRTDLISAICTNLKERDDLVVSWSLATGARQNEILALDLTQIPSSQSRRFTHDRVAEIYITETKGLKPRVLFVPMRLIDRTNRYIAATRAQTIRKLASERRTLTVDASRAVFVSASGNRLSARRIQKVFRDAADSAGSSARFHDLRHTFAIHRLMQLRAASLDASNPFDPLKTLKELLGHRHVSSVFIYLQALEVNPHIAEDALLEWVESWGRSR